MLYASAVPTLAGNKYGVAIKTVAPSWYAVSQIRVLKGDASTAQGIRDSGHPSGRDTDFLTGIFFEYK